SAAGLLGLAAWRTSRRWTVWVAAFALTCLVAFVVTPSDFVAAVVGFGLACTAIAVVARDNTVLWSKLVVGLYLPFHIGTAVAKAVYRGATGGESTIRTDPPPTAAFVPLVMLLTAIACGLAVRAIVHRRTGSNYQSNGELRRG
ncbi:MAG: hypothetical protein H0V37_03865, partial [Chloroflexia bacterium]|nr:hypothetical protein [Chloroflexia bacterium]